MGKYRLLFHKLIGLIWVRHKRKGFLLMAVIRNYCCGCGQFDICVLPIINFKVIKPFYESCFANSIIIPYS